MKPKFCIVGSGPAGMFLTKKLVNAGFRVEILESKFDPFGLVRYGVAPDNAKLKTSYFREFQDILSHPSVTLTGATPLNSRERLDQLRSSFWGVSLCTGMPDSMPLDVPNGEALGVYSAKDFVSWYNADPSSKFRLINPESIKDIVIVGMGNVALDVARILGANREIYDDQCGDWISEPVLSTLHKLSPGRITLVGRRDLSKAAFTTAALRDLMTVKLGRDIFSDPKSCRDVETIIGDPSSPRSLLRKAQVFHRALEGNGNSPYVLPKVCFQLQAVPDLIICNDEGLVSNLGLRVTSPSTSNFTKLRFSMSLKCDLLIHCLGYRSSLFQEMGLPVREDGSLETLYGRIENNSRLYACGWASTGSSGDVTSTMFSVNSTFASILDDYRRCC